MGWLKGFGMFGMLGLLLGAGAIALPAQDEQPSTNPVKFTTLVNFDLANGANVDVKPLIQGLDGNIYGTTGSGGANNAGTAFKMTPDGTLTTLYNFCALSGCGDGNGPGPGVRLGTDGEYYGVTDGGGVVGLGFGTVFRITAAGGLKTLHSFVGTDGAYPNSFLVQGTEGVSTGQPSQAATSPLVPAAVAAQYSRSRLVVRSLCFTNSAVNRTAPTAL